MHDSLDLGPSSKFAFRLEFSKNRPTVEFGWSWGGVTVEFSFLKKSRNYGNNAKIASGQGALLRQECQSSAGTGRIVVFPILSASNVVL